MKATSLLAAWDLQDDRKTLRTYRVSSSGAEFVERREVSPDEREAMNKQLLDRGTRIGYAYYGFLWMFDDGEFALWTKEAQLATGTTEELRVGEQSVRVSEINCIEVFVGPDNMGHRGVRADLGARTVVIAEEDFSVESNPMYDQMDLEWEINWAEFLGRDLAMWLRKAFADRHGKVMNMAQLLIYDACCELADRITGSEEIVKVLGPLDVPARSCCALARRTASDSSSRRCSRRAGRAGTGAG